MPLSVSSISALSDALRIDDENELTRTLTQDENDEWRFYRHSARHTLEVWTAALQSLNGRSIDAFAKATGVDRRALSAARVGRPERVLTWKEAVAIADDAGRALEQIFGIAERDTDIGR